MFEGSAALRLVVPASRRGRQDGRGHPRFDPTPEQRHQVELLAAYGLTHREVREFILNPTTGKPVSLRTLQRCFSSELRTGAVRAEVAVAANLFRIATRRRGRAAVRAAIFWLKSRAGWCDKCGQPCQEPGGAVQQPHGVVVAPAGLEPAAWLKQRFSEAPGRASAE